MYAKIQTHDGNIIVSGKIVDQKTTIDGIIDINLISFDYKWFFKTDNVEKYKILFSNEFIPLVNFNKKIYTNLTYDRWNNAINTFLNNIDVYEEYVYDEIDIEVKQLCDVLNLIPNLKTIGSCCGHNI